MSVQLTHYVIRGVKLTYGEYKVLEDELDAYLGRGHDGVNAEYVDCYGPTPFIVIGRILNKTESWGGFEDIVYVEDAETTKWDTEIDAKLSKVLPSVPPLRTIVFSRYS